MKNNLSKKTLKLTITILIFILGIALGYMISNGWLDAESGFNI